MNTQFDIHALTRAICTFVDDRPGRQRWMEFTIGNGVGFAGVNFINGNFPIEFIAGIQARASSGEKTLGIVGMNAVGRTVAMAAARGFGLRIAYYNARKVSEIEECCAASLQPLDTLLATADFICFALPLSHELEKMIGVFEDDRKPGRPTFVAWRRALHIERALHYLAEHFVDSVPLLRLAETAEVSKFHFARLFSTTIGVSPHRYQLLLRICHAKTLLFHGEDLADIALSTGFADQSHFCRAFQALVGVTPRRYQRRPFDLAFHKPGSAGFIGDVPGAAIRSSSLDSGHNRSEAD